MRLLLGNGQPHLRIALELLLSEQPGVEIVGTIGDGIGLTALIRTSDPDMIVADWDLPGRPMTLILSEARAMPNRPKVIILADRSQDHSPALEAGADAVVHKGSAPDKLLASFHQVRAAGSAKE